MYGMHLYITQDEFDAYIKNKLSDSDKEKFSDCTWMPLKLELNDTDMSIEAIVVPVKN